MIDNGMSDPKYSKAEREYLEPDEPETCPCPQCEGTGIYEEDDEAIDCYECEGFGEIPKEN